MNGAWRWAGVRVMAEEGVDCSVLAEVQQG